MRKVLFATTALVAVSGVAAVANAEVSISGGVEWRYDSISDDMTTTSVRASDSNFNHNMDTTISFSSTTDNGIAMSASQNFDDGAAGETTTSLSSDWGTVEVIDGSTTALAGSSYDVTSPTMSGSLGDMASTVYADSAGTATSGVEKNEAQLKDDHTGVVINYHSPSFAGFSFGFGSGELGNADDNTSTSMGAMYSGSAGDVSYSVGYATFDGTDSNTESTHIGASVSWDGVTVGAGSTTSKDSSGNEQDDLSIAATYKVSDDLTVGVGRNVSENDSGDKELQTTQIGVHYTIAPGLTASLGSNSFDYSTSGTTTNDGQSLQVEIKMSF